MEHYRLKPLTDELLDQIAERWKQHAGDEEFEVELGALFGICRGDLSFAQALANSKTDEVEALLEVVDTPFGRNGSTTKLLKIVISPEYWATNSPSRTRLVEIFASAAASVIANGIGNQRDAVKIYGRTDLMLEVLRSLTEVWDTLDTGWSAAMQGRWLTITTK